MVRELATWLDSTSLSWAVSGGYPWIWPACETLHFIGLTLLFGTTGLLDLRMLGFVRALPLRPIQELVRWGVAGFIVNFVTGVLFFSGDPFQYLNNPAFYWKMLCIALAGLNVALFYVTGLARRVDALGPGEDAPVGAKVIALTSIALWIGVTYWGRMLPFIGNAF